MKSSSRDGLLAHSTGCDMNLDDDEGSTMDVHHMEDPVNVFPHKISTSTLKSGSSRSKRTFLLKEKRESIVWETISHWSSPAQSWSELTSLWAWSMCENGVQWPLDWCGYISVVWSCFRCDHTTDLITCGWCDHGPGWKVHHHTPISAQKRRNKCDKEWINTNDDDGIYHVNFWGVTWKI